LGSADASPAIEQCANTMTAIAKALERYEDTKAVPSRPDSAAP
jgi:hypothetical protein